MKSPYATQVLFNMTQSISNQNSTVVYIYPEDDNYPPSLHINVLVAVFSSITFLLGTPGNILVIWVAGFKMKTINAKWILHLAIADLICCVSFPFLSVDFYFHYYSYYSDQLAYLFMIASATTYLSAFISVNFLAAMSIDRYISVIWPVWYKTHRTFKHVHITAAIIWVISLFLASFQVYYSIIPYAFNITVIYIFVTLFIICSAVIITCYCLIGFKIIKVKRPNRSRRSYRVITALIICLLICWGPFLICSIIDFFNMKISYIIKNISLCLACINSCINPIIYVFIGQNFKETFMDLLPHGIKKGIHCCNQTPRKPESDNETLSNTNV